MCFSYFLCHKITIYHFCRGIGGLFDLESIRYIEERLRDDHSALSTKECFFVDESIFVIFGFSVEGSLLGIRIEICHYTFGVVEAKMECWWPIVVLVCVDSDFVLI